MKLSLKVLFSPMYSLTLSVPEEPVFGRCERCHRIRLRNSEMVLGESSSSKYWPQSISHNHKYWDNPFSIFSIMSKNLFSRIGEFYLCHTKISRCVCFISVFFFFFFLNSERSVSLLSGHLTRLGGPYPCPSVRFLSLHGLSRSTFSNFWHLRSDTILFPFLENTSDTLRLRKILPPKSSSCSEATFLVSFLCQPFQRFPSCGCKGGAYN